MLQDDVFGLNVSVDDAERVQIPDGLADLLDDVAGGFLRKATLFLEHSVELSAGAQLQQQVYILLVVEEAEQLDDVRMVQARLDLKFAGELVYNVFLLHHFFRNDLQGAHKASEFVLDSEDVSELARTQLLTNHKVFDLMRALPSR